ncbi:MAG: HAD-IB family hydrolase, partial [Planctomycetaceae bacterium]
MSASAETDPKHEDAAGPAAAGDDTPIAVFDLDGTLLRSDSFLAFLMTFSVRFRQRRKLVRLPLWVAAYLLRLVSAQRAKQGLLEYFLGGEPSERIAEHAEWFCEVWLPSRLHPLGIELLRRHQAAGHRVILLSASPDLYVPAIGRALGIEETICTRVRSAEGRCLGVLDGLNCKGEAKLAALKDHLACDEAPPESFAYGDSAHDLPVLMWARQGVLIRRRTLRPLAKARQLNPRAALREG